MIESILLIVGKIKEYIHKDKTEFYTDEVIDKMLGGKDNYVELDKDKWKI